MQSPVLATVAMLALAGHVAAQCGTNQLTSPPNFVANNGGSAGGAVYFSLTTQAGAPNGVSICGFTVHTSTTLGTPINGVVYRHLSVTDWNLLTSTNVAAGNWCPVGLLTGTSNGTGIATPMALSTPLDIAPGTQVLLAIGGGNFAHRYTNGTGTNQSGTDGNLQFDGGKASNATFGSLISPRVANVTVDYNLPAAPVANTGCGVVARAASVGAGCGGAPGQVYEVFDTTTNPFDLVVPATSSEDLIFAIGGGQVTTLTVPGTPIVPPVSADLGLGDDQNTALIPLGFTIDGIQADAISVASNGYIWLGAAGAADFSETEAEFVAQGARLAVFWTDLNPTAGGSIHVDVNPNQALVTFQGVFAFNGTSAMVTAQAEITPNLITVRYDPNGGLFSDTVLVGLTNGIAPAAAPGSSNLNGGSVAPAAFSVNLQLAATALPRIGTTAQFRTSGIPTGAIAGTLLSLGPALSPGVPLAPLACGNRHVTGVTNIGLIFGAPSGTISINLPNDPGLVGVNFALQSVAAGGTIITSNALDCTVGNF